MHVRRLALLAALSSLALASTAHAVPAVKNGTWSTTYITEADGTKLHVSLLRPSNLKPTDKTPVVLTISVYDNSSGELGPAGPAEGADYDPVGPSDGSTANYLDWLADPRLMDKGYSYAIVDMRGTGGSTGCQDWAGPGEQADVSEAVEWAASQPWSTGHVAIFGKSYDGVTGLLGTALHPKGLDAVLSMEPVYDGYRYLYGDGMRRSNWALTPALYDAISASPGAIGDIPSDNGEYFANSVNDTQRPGCPVGNFADQAGNDDHYSAFWRERNIIAREKGSTVPLFLTQGTIENNTAPDGLVEFLAARDPSAPTRAWLGPWNHVRGNQVNDAGKLMEGRPGFYDEIYRFFDKYLKGEQPAVQDPNFAVQTNDGIWRTEDKWPPADAHNYTTALSAGSYTDDATSNATGSGSDTGVWTISPPLTSTEILSGAPQATVDVSAALPDANLVVDVYDIGPNGTGPLVSRQGHLIRTNGPIDLGLMSTDWKFKAGHRIAVRVTDNNQDWWLAAVPTKQTVTVYGGQITLPFLAYTRSNKQLPGHIASDALPAYLGAVATPPAGTKDDPDFNVPPAPVAPPSGS